VPRRPTFDMLRAAFWLLAALLAAQTFATLFVIGGCAWAVLVQHTEPMGACQQVGTQVREVWSEALAAILALLLASRTPPPPDEPS